MREIKFRAWDKIEKKMWIPVIDKDGIPCAQHPISRQLVRMDGELLDPIMQYTGLKDKNGKEIYESDLIKVYDWGINNTAFLGMTTVVWDVDECGWRYNDLSLTEDFYDQFRNVEVVGNVHEGIIDEPPELLEPTNA